MKNGLPVATVQSVFVRTVGDSLSAMGEPSPLPSEVIRAAPEPCVIFLERIMVFY